MKSILQGMVIGIANVMPGVSGGTLMVAMGIYDRLLHCITHLFREFKKNVQFLTPIALGMVIAIVAGTFGLEYFFGRFPLQTNLLFIGLIVGGLPAIWDKVRDGSIRAGHIAAGMISFAIVVTIAMVGVGNPTAADLTFGSTNVIKLAGVGVVAAATMVIPGVSGSMVLMLLGYYHPIINTVNDFIRGLAERDTEMILQGLGFLVPFGIGLAAGVFLIAKLVELLFEKYPLHAYWAIMGLIVASPIAIFFVSMEKFPPMSLNGILTGVIALGIGVAIAFKLGD